jgi:hypothetical protein
MCAKKAKIFCRKIKFSLRGRLGFIILKINGLPDENGMENGAAKPD